MIMPFSPNLLLDKWILHGSYPIDQSLGQESSHELILFLHSSYIRERVLDT
jgi:hypothetical protein